MAETVVVKESSETAADEAQRAAASAQVATEAATAAIGLAAVEAARNKEAAASEVASYEARMHQWTNQLNALSQSLSEAEARNSGRLDDHAAAIAKLIEDQESTRQSLPPEPPPSPASQTPSQPAADQKPAEPPAPERKRAHRWI
jgi:hypothetical protein